MIKAVKGLITMTMHLSQSNKGQINKSLVVSLLGLAKCTEPLTRTISGLNFNKLIITVCNVNTMLVHNVCTPYTQIVNAISLGTCEKAY